MVRTYSQQKSALTRAVKSGVPGKVREEVARTVREWDSGNWRPYRDRPDTARPGAWPDDWSRWQRALDDVYPIFQAPELQELI